MLSLVWLDVIFHLYPINTIHKNQYFFIKSMATHHLSERKSDKIPNRNLPSNYTPKHQLHADSHHTKNQIYKLKTPQTEKQHIEYLTTHKTKKNHLLHSSTRIFLTSQDCNRLSTAGYYWSLHYNSQRPESSNHWPAVSATFQTLYSAPFSSALRNGNRTCLGQGLDKSLPLLLNDWSRLLPVK